jgi:uncharacterized protein YjiS (DUF1127 family)
MAQMTHIRQVLPIRSTSTNETEVRMPMLGQTRSARRWRVFGALRWLLHLLFVQPVGRRARLEGLGRLSDHTLRDIGLMRVATSGYAAGQVPMHEHPRHHANVQPLAAREVPERPMTLIRLHEAA